MKENIQKIFLGKPVHKQLTEAFHVKFAVLFGSMASGTIRQDSDVDLGIFFEKKLAKNQEKELVKCLKNLLQVDRLDAVCLNDASCSLRYELTQNGILLYEHHEDDYLAFCIRTFKEFEEMNFLNRHYYEMKIHELKEVL
ncbi:MAG: nucleotidyltransferase domain-containing protein [bacterium]